ncbi:MAG: hypothetical protein H6696_07210 [Deferribacteres bacterium]|nr:hypothetical protein [candidate division KSB1 bacterium]MCB9501711.1 hypothetical protein [Deferribacteres bacterium]
MKRIFALIALLLVPALSIQGAEYKGGQTVHIAAGDTVATDLMATGRSVEIEGTMLGDVFAAGENVYIEGDVGDDIFAAGRNLNITGAVGGMLIGGGETVLIDTEIADDVFIGGGTVRITGKAHIHGNVYIGTGNLLFEGGRIDGNLRGGSGDTYLNGEVDGYIEWGTGHVQIGDRFSVAGDFELELPATLEGKEIENLPSKTVVKYKEHEYGGSIFKTILVMLMAIIFGLCYVLFFKNFSKDQITYARNNALQGVGVGFLALVATPVFVVILAVIFLTIPIALFLLAIYLMLLYLSGIISAVFLGNEILARTGKSQPTLALALILGVVLLTLLKLIPILGFLVSLIVVSFGMGSFLLYLWSMHNDKNMEPSA